MLPEILEYQFFICFAVFSILFIDLFTLMYSTYLLISFIYSFNGLKMKYHHPNFVIIIVISDQIVQELKT